MRMVAEKLRGLPDFPPQLRSLVEHMILSHHGQLEFGSPKLPMFPEALLLHYLDELDEAGVPVARRLLAALGPRMLALSAARSAGAHPYLVTPAHTRRARAILGEDALLAPEQKVVLEPDPARARAIGRPAVEKPYLGLVNYTNNLRSLGFDDGDLAGGGSDRLIDALVAHGDAATVADELRQHLAAGADHVAVNLLMPPGQDPIPGYTALAEALMF